MEWYLKVLRQYADFNGRARRTEYWMFTLINLLISLSLSALQYLLDVSLFGIISSIYSIAVLIPTIAVAIRRLHDIGKSGWFLLLAVIPIIGAIWLLVLFVTDGNPHENEYGPDPKDAYAEQIL